VTAINAGKRWIHAQLAASTALTTLVSGRIYDTVVPDLVPPAALPYVVYQFQGGADLMTNGAARVWQSGIYLVRGVARFPYANLDAIAQTIDVALHALAGSVAAGTVYACVREQPFELDETTEGVQYRHLGGLYRAFSKES
jgi:hypothetical protein